MFVIGDHCAPLANSITYNLYEYLLGLEITPWSDRWLQIKVKAKQADIEAREKAGADRVVDTNPSHPLPDYAGEYTNPIYGTLKIIFQNEELQFNFGSIDLPLSHYHYDRFDTPDDERYGKRSLNFLTNPQGDINQVTMSLDQAEVTFKRQGETLERQLLEQLAGTYETAAEFKLQVVLKEDLFLYLLVLGQSESKLIPYKNLTFQVSRFSDVKFEFVMEKGQVKALKQKDPTGEYLFQRCED